jgi:hypothetical protein
MPIGSFTAQPIATGVGKIVRQLVSTPVAGAAASGNGAVAQVSTVTFSSPSNSSPYSISVTDPFTFVTAIIAITTDSGTSAAEASAAMYAAFIANPLAFGLFSAADDGAGVVTLTARTPGLAITVAEVVDTGAHMAVATPTVAAAATEYTFGKAVEIYFVSGVRKARIPPSPTLGTVTLTITHAASSTYLASLSVLDYATNSANEFAISFASGANVTATGANAVAAAAAINTFGPGAITATAATPVGSDVVVTITLPAGMQFTSGSKITTGSGAALTIGGGVDASNPGVLALVYDPGDDSSDTYGTGSRTTIRGGTAVPYMLRGAALLVNPAAAPSAGDFVFVDLAASGALTPTRSQSTVALVGAGSQWKFTGESQVIGTTTYYVAEAA